MKEENNVFEIMWWVMMTMCGAALTVGIGLEIYRVLHPKAEAPKQLPAMKLVATGPHMEVFEVMVDGKPFIVVKSAGGVSICKKY